MKRLLLSQLKQWKQSSTKKPLLLLGARQVGKTWLMKEFGKTQYDNVVYLNFDTNKSIHRFFENDISPENIIKKIELEFQVKIEENKTLIIFDEIQECQRAKDSLKYFNECEKKYHIVSAGSFLGVSGGKFPVGQVDILTLYPLSFTEFLMANGRDDLVELMKSKKFSMIESVSHIYIELLKIYFFVGGMPNVVNEFLLTKNFEQVRNIQQSILSGYKGDFSRHINVNDIAKVRMLWDSIPSHLSKEKHKFVYKEIKVGARAKEFETAMNWLINTGVVYKINRVQTPKIPLTAFSEDNIFKLYTLDIGLLNAMAELSVKDVFDTNKNILDTFKGIITEQFICQELKANYQSAIFYWGRDKATAEVDFLIQCDGNIVPIEVKSDIHTQSKSLSVYIKENNPKYAVRTSLKNYGIKDNLYSIPLYMIGYFKNFLK